LRKAFGFRRITFYISLYISPQLRKAVIEYGRSIFNFGDIYGAI
jgi:hypothetical protein